MACCYRFSSMVCWFVTVVSPAKMAEPSRCCLVEDSLWPKITSWKEANFDGKEADHCKVIGTLCREVCNKCWAVAEMGIRLATINMGWTFAPFAGGGPHLTLCPGPRPAFLPSGILIHLAVWPQLTWAENCLCSGDEACRQTRFTYLQRFFFGWTLPTL